ncbi:19025_t:CDS:1, partial [Racocetra fulgida]
DIKYKHCQQQNINIYINLKANKTPAIDKIILETNKTSEIDKTNSNTNNKENNYEIIN